MSHHYPKVGEQAPDFELPAVGDKKIRLSDFRGKKNVVLSFHPLAWTGICAAQMKDLQENIKRLTDKDTVALGISVDSIPSKKAWAESLGIKDVEMLADFEPKGAVAKLYGIYRQEGFSERAVFVVDKQGVIRFAKVYPIKEKPDVGEFCAVL
ncbi:MAG: peroxiredoxin [candidate division KSB1 bacterium]|nr:peroxiredoxin [candidate division KSB1 bacterium]MDZ7393837.1 peroxiredoxin [candidate division KSB1 bacterium]MDZ7412772.1 peroxiredoxin [candidate division KSB1 bacterium]